MTIRTKKTMQKLLEALKNNQVETVSFEDLPKSLQQTINSRCTIHSYENDFLSKVVDLSELKYLNKQSIKLNFSRNMNWQKFLLALKKAMSHPFSGVRWSGMKSRVILRPIMKHGEAIRCEVFTDDLLSSITLDVPVNAFHNLKVNARDLLEAA